VSGFYFPTLTDSLAAHSLQIYAPLNNPYITQSFFTWRLHRLIIHDGSTIVIHLFGLLKRNLIDEIDFT
jgi:hypothetical protein